MSPHRPSRRNPLPSGEARQQISSDRIAPHPGRCDHIDPVFGRDGVAVTPLAAGAGGDRAACYRLDITRESIGCRPEGDDVAIGGEGICVALHGDDDTECCDQAQYSLYRTLCGDPDRLCAAMTSDPDSSPLPDLPTPPERLAWAMRQRGCKSAVDLWHLIEHRESEPTVRSRVNGHRPLTTRAAPIYAQYLGVPWQWLAGIDQIGIAEGEAEYLKNFHALDERGRRMLLRYSRLLLEEQAENSPHK